MKKNLFTVVMAVLLAVGFAATSVSAAYVTCTVESVDGEKVTLNCGDDATDFQKDDNVKVKAEKKAIEGC